MPCSVGASLKVIVIQQNNYLQGVLQGVIMPCHIAIHWVLCLHIQSQTIKIYFSWTFHIEMWNDKIYLKIPSSIQFWQIGFKTARMKKGSQQIIKAPVTIAKVLAAFLSRFDSNETCFLVLLFFFWKKLRLCQVLIPQKPSSVQPVHHKYVFKPKQVTLILNFTISGNF